MNVYWRVELIVFRYEQGDDEDDLTWDMESEEVVSIHDNEEEAHEAAFVGLQRLGVE
jgi:hypothetical protein